jgi:hypothetical protein
VRRYDAGECSGNDTGCDGEAAAAHFDLPMTRILRENAAGVTSGTPIFLNRSFCAVRRKA